MSDPGQLVSALCAFAARVADLALPAPTFFTVADLRDRKSPSYNGWADAPGVYLFEQGSTVQYVGRALPRTGLRARVYKNCTSFGDPAWDAVITDPATRVGVLPLAANDWYWAPSLEAFLIDKLAPPINKRAV